MKKIQVVIASCLGLIGLSGIILLGSHVIINQKNQEFVNKSSEFLSQFPVNKSNQSSDDLDLLLVKVGLKPVNINPQQYEQKSTPEIENLLTSINSFLQTILRQKTNKYQPITKDLQQFLDKNQIPIIEIQDYILISEKPTWNYNLQEMFNNPLNYQLPHLVGILNLQKIFMLKILSDYHQGNMPEVNQTLEVSLKINQSIQSQPDLISQLVSLIVTEYQLGILRQIKDLAPQWETKLINYSYNYQEGILNAIKIESLMIGSPFYLGEESSNIIFNLFEKPYWQIMAQDTAQRMKNSFTELQNQDICSANLTELETQLQDFPWWNIHADIATPNFSKQWLRGGTVMLDLELTQKILQTEVIKQKTGQYPDSLPNLNSQICPEQKWQYQKTNNQVTLNFSQELPWQNQEENQGNIMILPLTFTFNN